MPRRTNSSTARIHVSLPEADLALLDHILEDPRTGKAKYGARTKLIEELLRRLILAYRHGNSEVKVDDLFYIMNG